MEVWAKVKDLDFVYVSNLGNVKKIISGHEIFIHKYPYKGYLKIGINRKSYFVHRLVANSFLFKSCEKHEVNHKNGKKSDNRVENLEWVSHSENIKHAYDTGLISFKNRVRNKKLNIDLVDQIRREYIPRITPQRSLAKKYNVSVFCINDIVNNKTWMKTA